MPRISAPVSRRARRLPGAPLAFVLVLLTAAFAGAQTFNEFPVPTRAAQPNAIVAGPDGNLWFTELNGNKIARLATDGTITEFSIPTAGSGPNGIVTGPDGNLWFTEFNVNQIGRVTTTGTFTEFAIPTSGSEPAAIENGPDGNLWVTEFAGNQIARLTTAGVVTEFPIPTSNSRPQDIVTGPDGNLWFAEGLSGKIGRITPSGVITEFSLPSSSSFPEGMANGPDGNLWFVEFSGNNVGRITPSGTITEFPIPTAASNPDTIANGVDGNLWFTERSGNKIGRITPTGVFTEFDIPTAGSGTVSIAAGPDGSMWFTERTANQIGQLTTGTLIVINTNDSGPGSLRGTIIFANSIGADLIRFAIPGAGVHVIQPLSQLPEVTFPYTIDGYTQPGASPNTLAVGTNAVIQVVIDGSSAGAAEGLVLNTEGAHTSPGKSFRRAARARVNQPRRISAAVPVVRGLAINNFSEDGIEVFADSAQIEGCFLGTNAAGDTAAGNASGGIYLGSAAFVGGPSPAQRNLISGNLGDGIQFSANGSVVQGNLIGTDATGTAPLPNAGDGIRDPFSASLNVVGGEAAGQGNVIAFNGGHGVDIACQDGCGTNNLISGNSIFSNAGLGISLDGTSTPIPNDACDGDSGGNDQQNYPILTSAGAGPTSVLIQGTLNSTASTMFTVEFFSNTSCGPGGVGQGQTYLGSTTVTTDATCNAAISVVLPAVLVPGDFVTATATEPGNDTSEFSPCVAVTSTIGPSSTALTSAPNPSTFGQTVTLTATVTGSAPTPTGLVTFLDGGTPLMTVALNASGVATFSTSTFSVGIHNLTAVYAGDALHSGSMSPTFSQTVLRAPTLTALMSSVNPSAPGQSVTFTAVVSPFAPAAGVPTGTVTFQDGAAVLGSVPLASGQATLSTSSLSVGTHSITAVYGGDATYAPSTSSPLSQRVGVCQKPQPVSDLSINPSRAAPGESYELRWTDVLAGQAGQYEVFFSTDGGASYHAIGYTTTNQFNGSPTQPPGTVLTFTVRAEPSCSVGTTNFSDMGNTVTLTVTGACAKPAAPTVTIDNATLGSGDPFTLSWNSTLPSGPGGPAGQYDVLQAVGAGSYVSIGLTSATTFSGTTPDVPAGTSVSLVVRAEPSCATSSADFGAPSAPVVLVVAPTCVGPGEPSNVTILPVGSATGPPTPTDYLAVAWAAPTSGNPATRYGVRINGDPEVSTSSTGAILLPRGERLDPITAFVRAFSCSPEQAGGTAQSDTISLLVTPPIANFSVSGSPRAGAPVTFTDTSSPQATSWLWVFDDGATDSRQSPTHTFATAGSHIVYLIASNGAGSSTKAMLVIVASATAASLDAVLMTETEFDKSDPERRRAHVRLSGEGSAWLKVINRENSVTLLFLRFLDGAGNLARERALTIGPGDQASYDLGAYGLSGDWTLEIVGVQKFEARVVQARRPSPKEVRR